MLPHIKEFNRELGIHWELEHPGYLKVYAYANSAQVNKSKFWDPTQDILIYTDIYLLNKPRTGHTDNVIAESIK